MPEPTQPMRVYAKTIAAVKAEPMPDMTLPERVHILVEHGINRQQYHHDGYAKAIADITAAIERGEPARKAADRLLLEYRP